MAEVYEAGTPRERAIVQEAAVVSQENRVFRMALERGDITQAQFDEAMKYQTGRVSDNEPPRDEKGQPVMIQQRPETTAYLKSQSFYTQVGRPEFAGKYAAPNIPPGYEVYSVEEVGGTPTGRPPMSGSELRGEKTLKFTLVPQFEYVQDVPSGVTGPVLYKPRKATAEEKKQLQERWLKGEDVSAGGAIEARALAGLTLATAVVAPIATAETLALAAVQTAGAVATPVAGQVIKKAVKGEDLTLYEAIALSAAGVQIARGGYRIAESGVIQRIGRGAYERIFPERAATEAMYNRVVLEESLSKSQGGTGAPVGSKSWIEQVKTRVSPNSGLRSTLEKAVIEPNKPTAIGTPSTSDAQVFQAGSKGRVGTVQWAKETQVRQTSAQKAPMKAFDLETVAKMNAAIIPVVDVRPLTLETKTRKKTTTARKAQDVANQAAQEVVDISRQQTGKVIFTEPKAIENPFTKFSGKPFYSGGRGRASAIVDEDVYLSYPEGSPLGAPSTMGRPEVLLKSTSGAILDVNAGRLVDVDLGQFSRLVQGQGFAPLSFEGVASIQGQRQDAIQDLVQDLVQRSVYEQVLEQTVNQSSWNTRRLFNLPTGFELGKGYSFDPRQFTRVGRGERVYPIVTGADFLEDIYGTPKKTRKTKRKSGGRKK